jgi:glutaredoxin 3
MKIEIFGKPNCPYCTSAKNLLQMKQIGYDYIDFFELDNEQQTKVRERAPTAGTFPMIFLEDTYIGGFAQLQSVFN